MSHKFEIKFEGEKTSAFAASNRKWMGVAASASLPHSVCFYSVIHIHTWRLPSTNTAWSAGHWATHWSSLGVRSCAQGHLSLCHYWGNEASTALSLSLTFRPQLLLNGNAKLKPPLQFVWNIGCFPYFMFTSYIDCRKTTRTLDAGKSMLF